MTGIQKKLIIFNVKHPERTPLRSNNLRFTGQIIEIGHGLWGLKDMYNGFLIKPLHGHTGIITSLAFSNNTLASSSKDNTVKFWTLNSYSAHNIETIEGDFDSRSISSVSFSPDGKKLALANDRNIKIYDLANNKIFPIQPSQILQHSDYVIKVEFSHDGNMMVSYDQFGDIFIWDVKKEYTKIRLPNLKSEDIACEAFSSDSKIIAFAIGGSIKFCDGKKGNLLQTIDVQSNVTALAFSPDNKNLIVGADTNIEIWNFDTKVISRTLLGHTGVITSVAVTPDTQTIISGSRDGSIKRWNLSDGKLLSENYLIDNDGFIVIIPGGYYFCRSTESQYFDIKINNKIFCLSQYSNYFRNVDYVTSALRNKTAVVPKLAIQIEKDFPPNIQLINKNEILLSNKKTINIVCRYKGQVPWYTFNCEQNGQPIKITEFPEKRDTATFIVPVTLDSGKNVIRVIASDTKQLLSKKLEHTITYHDNSLSIDGEKGPMNNNAIQKKEIINLPYPKKFAVLIGISDYKELPDTLSKEQFRDLKYCHKDAEEFKKILEDEEKSGGDWNITCLKNDSATSSNVDEALSSILTSANQNDLIFIFFSGHGRAHKITPDDIYLLTYDFKFNDNRSGFSYKTLQDLMIKSKAEHIVAFIDACQSGVIGFKGDDRESVVNEEFRKKIQMMKTNKVIFTSGSGSQSAREDDKLQQGIFSYFLLKGMKGEAKEQNNNLFIDLGELRDYVKDNVEKFTKNSQIPQIFEASGIPANDFPIAIRSKK